MKKLTILFFLLIASSAHSVYFEQLTTNPDKHCENWNPQRFEMVDEYFTLTVENKSHPNSFDYGAFISRAGLDIIYFAVRNQYFQDTSSAPNFQQFETHLPLGIGQVYYKNLREQYEIYYKFVVETINREENINPNVGYILEVIARFYLQNEVLIYPADQYTITGGVAYSHDYGNIIGELDIIVYESESCDVVAVGESKASTAKKALDKSRGQLRRFERFMDEQPAQD